MFHPATLLLVWAGFALLLPLLPLPALAALVPLFLFPALLAARPRTLALLRRARWLLLSLALLFAFATPGLALPGLLGATGMTQDGLLLGGEHVLRLVLLLATLSLLHERLGTAGFVAGLYWLLGPLRRWGGLRERIVVRLMLVVEYVEHGNASGGWRAWLEEGDAEPQSLNLSARRAQWPDWLALLLVAGILGALAWQG